jgi:hypothetical protein
MPTLCSNCEQSQQRYRESIEKRKNYTHGGKLTALRTHCADRSGREPPFVETGIRERPVLPERESPDLVETPTGVLLFPVGEEVFSGGKM